jgi:hypothetical protein
MRKAEGKAGKKRDREDRGSERLGRRRKDGKGGGTGSKEEGKTENERGREGRGRIEDGEGGGEGGKEEGKAGTKK